VKCVEMAGWWVRVQYSNGDVGRRTLDFLGILFEQAALGRRGGWLDRARTSRVYLTDSVLGSWGHCVLYGVRGSQIQV